MSGLGTGGRRGRGRPTVSRGAQGQRARPGRRPAPRQRWTVRPAPPPAPASAQSGSSAAWPAWTAGSRIRLRPRCGRPRERARPWPVAAVAERPGRTVLPAYGSRGWPGPARGCGTTRGSRPWPSSSPGSSLGPLGITRPGARCRRDGPVRRMPPGRLARAGGPPQPPRRRSATAVPSTTLAPASPLSASCRADSSGPLYAGNATISLKRQSLQFFLFYYPLTACRPQLRRNSLFRSARAFSRLPSQ